MAYNKNNAAENTFFNTCLRRIHKIRWPEKIKNEDLLERAGQEPVAKQILRRKWGWIGHTLRKPASSSTCSRGLRLRKIFSDDADFDIKAARIETFFASRGYPDDVIRWGRERTSTKSRVEILKSVVANNTGIDSVPFVTTFHPRNLVVP